MNKSAILHIPMSQYAYGTDEEHVTIRLRAQRGDLSRCVLYYGDRACRLTPVIFTEAEMTVVAQSPLYDYWEAELTRPYKRLCYYFALEGSTAAGECSPASVGCEAGENGSLPERILYYGDRFSHDTVDDRSEYFQLPFNHRADIVRPPEWAQDAVIYNIFPDSFATERRVVSGEGTEVEYMGRTCRGKLGGTIRGLTANVDYLQELGVNAIYINPIFAAGEYHKYDLIDYFRIDPAFGTNEDFRELVNTFHAHGIRVIIDGVFNHCGWHFPAFEDVVQKGEASEYKDWFYGLTYPVVRPEDPEEYPGYECFGYERMMPKLDTANPAVAEYICRVGRYWIEEFGIDGWRLDVASEIDDGFWRKFHRTVKAVDPDAILIGEVWETANHWLDGTIFDSTMNYDFRKHCKRFFAEVSEDAAEFDGRVTDLRMRYRKQTVYAQLNVLDSHDVSRFLSVCGEDQERYQLAVLFQMTFPGMPSVFYGDELGLTGIEEADYRQPMPWGAEGELFTFFRTLIRLRREEELLRRGGWRTVYAQEGGGLYVYERYGAGGAIRVMINRNKQAADVAEYLPAAGAVPGAKILMQKGLEGSRLSGMGFVMAKY